MHAPPPSSRDDALYLRPLPPRPSATTLIHRRASKRLNICAFSPLPSIVASPISTPVPSTSQDPLAFPTTPTWIATPPTPPPRSTVRRSNTTTSTRPTGFSPSTSFPASMHPHGQHHFIHHAATPIKRCVSVPDLSLRPKELVGSFTSFMGPHIVQSPDAFGDTDFDSDLAFSFRVGTDGPLPHHHVRPIFHIDNDDDKADTVSIDDKADSLSPEEISPAGSWSDHSVDDVWETERMKDSMRRFHALKELLATEAGYLMDLKVFVTVYLRNLPTLASRSLASTSTFGRGSSSFTSGPWMYSYTQLQAAAVASSTNLSDAPGTPATPAPTSAKESKTRYLFTDSELDSLTRNAEDILQLHEQFVRELRVLLEPLDFGMEMAEDHHAHLHSKNLDAAIRVVSAKFATEASRFKDYQEFCAGHAVAMDIMRKAYQQFPVELDAFEQRCSTMAAEMMDMGTKPPASEPRPAATEPPSARASMEGKPAQTLAVDERKRTMSLTSLDGAVRSLRPRASMTLMKESTTASSSETRPRVKANSLSTGTSPPRIAFTDYMIKPIQRICKYPLLLDQLLPGKALRTLSQPVLALGRSSVDVVVESATQAMRHVAAAVDEARHRQNIATQSALIVSRVSLGTTFGASNPAPGVVPLTTEFIAGLGDCILSGSLDVMHYNLYKPWGQNSSIKVKYLGAFLYSGGYLLLVKVSKGKKYEPRHWFSLADFEVVDVEDDGSMLPCSFKLFSGDKHFELAAACQREKDAWLTSIHQALCHIPTWTTEPTPSYRFDEKGELLPELEDPATISFDPQSQPSSSSSSVIHYAIPELAGSDSESTAVEPFFASLRVHGKTKQRRRPIITTGAEQDAMPFPPSRRSSSTSVKAIFSPMASSDTETVVIRRSSQAARAQVDHELQDVISQSCITARSYAFTHEEELFQAPQTQKAARSGFPRSNSGIGMAGMARLSKHESVRVPRRKTAESFELKGGAVLSASAAGRKMNVTKLSIVPLSEADQEETQQLSLSPSPSPSPPAASKPLTPFNRVSSRGSENDSAQVNIPSPVAAQTENTSSTPKSRSFARGVRGLFQFRPSSPMTPFPTTPTTTASTPIATTAAGGGPSLPAPQQQQTTTTTLQPAQNPDSNTSYADSIHRWAHKSLRRRTRSVHDEPLDDADDQQEKEQQQQQFVLPPQTKSASSPLPP